MAPMRKSHTKSRDGCAQCKQRHRKCDEVRPRCGSCQRLKTSCSLGTRTLSSSVPSPATSVSTSTDSQRSVDVADLELFQNSLFNLTPVLVEDETKHLHFIKRFGEVALQHTYLLHSMLAISALHMLSQDRERTDLFMRAANLQEIAVGAVQPHIITLSKEHSIPVFMFAGLTSTFSLAEAPLSPRWAEQSFDPVAALLDCFQLTRGITTVMTPHWNHVRTSWIAPALNITDCWDSSIPMLQHEFPTYGIVRALSFGIESEDHKRASIYATERVFLYLWVLRSHTDVYTATRVIQSWPIEVDAHFQEMLAQRKPVALIILAYYAVLLNCNKDVWWATGWSSTLIRHIEEGLGIDWVEFLRWPKEAIDGVELADS